MQFKMETLEEYSKKAKAMETKNEAFVTETANALRSGFLSWKHGKPGFLNMVHMLTGISVSTLFRKANPDSKSSEHARKFSFEDATKVSAAISAIRKHELR